MDIARRFLAALLIAVLSLFTVACNGDDGGGDDVEAEEGENGEDD
jgi:predicted small secreted protein